MICFLPSLRPGNSRPGLPHRSLYINLPVHGVVSATRHRLHHLLLEQPAGHLPKFCAAYSAFACGHIVDDVERLQKRKLEQLEQGTGRGFQPATFGARPVIVLDTLVIVSVAALSEPIATLPLQDNGANLKILLS